MGIHKSSRYNNYTGRTCWYAYNSGLQPKPCGGLKPTKNNIYDLLGNVSEWCWDRYDSNYYKYSPETNPKGPSEVQAPEDVRVVRGGSCYDGKSFVRPQRRSKANESNFIVIILVRTLK